MTFQHNLFFDTEVKAPFKGALDKLGLDVYSRHPDTRLLLLQYAIDDGPETVIDVAHGQLPTRELIEAWRDPSVQIVAHNAQFDRVVMMNTARAPAPIDRWYCTRARAYAHGLPGALESLSTIYKLGDAAKKDGEALVQLFCERGEHPDAHPLEWLRFLEYASYDITALRQLYRILPAWCFTPREQALYHLDQRINDRGFKADLPLASKIIEVSEQAAASLNQRVQALTNGAIQKGTQREKVQTFINGFSDTNVVNDMRAETLRKVLRDHKAGAIQLHDSQVAMIELRLMSSKSSVSKCRTALDQVGPGDRIRYSLNYGGGGRILRWSHKGYQPGNLPRPTREQEEIDAAIEMLNLGVCYSIYGDESLGVGSDCLRGLMIADEGKKLSVADYSNIEGRILAWYAGEEWKLQAYRDQDAGKGADGYKLLGNRMTGKPVDEITKFERQQFKGCDLSMGYEGGVGAFLNIANSYQLDLVELAKVTPKVLPAEFMERGRASWAWAVRQGDTHGLPENIYVACAASKFAYREACANIANLWSDLLTCAKTAVMQPGKVFETAKGKVKMACTSDSRWLSVLIPSGRQIMLASPKIKMEKQWAVKEDGTKVEKPPKAVLVARKSPMWRYESIYGGLLANLITQGLARDILADAQLDVDAEGFPIIMHVHDEIVVEIDDADPRTHDDLIEVMLRQAKKYPGLPLAAAGYTAKRARKG